MSILTITLTSSKSVSMTMPKNVQFRSVDAVLTAYRNSEVPTWSIWAGKQFLFKYVGESIDEGAALMEQVLENLSQSRAIYTLKVHEEVPGGRLTDKTDYDGSFNFLLKEDERTPAVLGGGSDVLIRELLESNRALSMQVQELKQRIDEEPGGEENTGINGMLAGLIADPQALVGLIGVIKEMFSGNSNQPPRHLGAVPALDLEAIGKCVEDIEQVEPNARQFIFKLGEMARTNPKKCKGLFATLRMFIK